MAFHELLLSSWYPALSLIVILPLLVVISDYWKAWHLPPGPTPIPFFGNKFIIPQQHPWIKFEEWSKKYGPIFTLWIGRRPTLVVSDPIIAVDLLEKRSNKYSSRPRFVMMGELLWDMASILVQPYGKEWLIRRKLLHSALTPAALKLYKPVQESEASRLCGMLLRDPDSFEKLFDRFTASVVFSISYGHRIDSMNAKVVRQRLEWMQFAANVNVPGKYLAETVPILARIPEALAPWKKEIRDVGRIEAEANMALVEGVKRDIEQGQAEGREIPDSLCKLLLKRKEKEDIALSERDFSFVPASLFGAGSDTTASTMCSGILALITHPSTLRAAQAELDAIIGPDRTPTFEDEPHLPYIRALCKEILRWRPVAVLGGTPHSSSEDDVYEGWRIPANTTILCNSWAINLNEQYYPNPHHFNPFRFVDAPVSDEVKKAAEPADVNYKPGVKKHPSKSGHSSFGWGRRICPGADLAANSLFVAIAKLCWGFNIKGRKGVTYDTFAYTEGFNIRPLSYQCDFTVRSEKHRRVLEQEYKQANAYMERFTPFSE